MTNRYRLLLVDQALYAASNLAAVVLAGRVADPDGFGRFMLAFLGLSAVVNGVRAVWSEPEVARRRASAGPSREVAVMVAAAASMVAAAGIAGRVPWIALVAAAGAAAVLQDRLRYRALLRQDAAAAVRSDALWAVGMAVAGIALAGGAGVGSGRTPTVTTVLALWTLGASASALVNLPPRRTLATERHMSTAEPVTITGGAGAEPADASGAPRRRRSGRGLFLADFALQSGATQAAGLLLGLVMAAGPYGELRAAITLLGPIGVANTALTTQLLAGRPAGARLVAGIAGAALGVVAALAAVPARVGVAALGSAWPDRAVLVLIGITVAAQTVSTWGLTRLKLAARRRALLVLRAAGALGLAGAAASAAALSGRAAPVAAAYLAVNAVLALAATALAPRSPTSGPAAAAADEAAPVAEFTRPGLARTV